MVIDRRFRFVRPTRQLRELLILSALSKDRNLSQRTLAAQTALSSTMVNQYVSEMVHGGLIDVDGQNNRNLCYRLTPHGKCRKNELFFQCSREIIQLYGAIKQEFRRRLAQHHKEGIRRVVLFGGAETGEIAYNACKMVGIKVLGVVDNDPAKHGARLGDVQITGPWTIEDLRPHAVIITSFGHMDEIYEQVRYLEGKGIKIKRL